MGLDPQLRNELESGFLLMRHIGEGKEHVVDMHMAVLVLPEVGFIRCSS